MIARFINAIGGMAHKSYLELGVGNGRNFEAVRARRKTAVDINGRAPFTCTTDEYFERHVGRRRFDVIFIDADHRVEQVLRDFNHAVACCRGWVLIHDLIPPSQKFTADRFCADSYKLLAYFWARAPFEFYPLDCEYGLTFVRMPARPVDLVDFHGFYASTPGFGFSEFQALAAGRALYSRSEILEVLRG